MVPIKLGSRIDVIRTINAEDFCEIANDIWQIVAGRGTETVRMKIRPAETAVAVGEALTRGCNELRARASEVVKDLP